MNHAYHDFSAMACVMTLLLLINSPFLQNWCFYGFTFVRMDRLSSREMPLKPHEWPFKLQKWAFWGFKNRSFRDWDL